METCALPECDKPRGQYKRGWCIAHYGRWLQWGDPCAGRRYHGATTRCEAEDCQRGGPFSRGFCKTHYARLRRHGSPDVMKRRASGTGSIGTDARGAYVRVFVNGRGEYEHRVVMERHLGRKLRRHEHVHHLNGDGLDNRLANLELLTAHEHAKRHELGTRVRGSA